MGPWQLELEVEIGTFRSLCVILKELKDAFHNVMCYIGTPDEFKNMEITNVNANASKLSTLNMVRVGEICKELGGKKW